MNTAPRRYSTNLLTSALVAAGFDEQDAVKIAQDCRGTSGRPTEPNMKAHKSLRGRSDLQTIMDRACGREEIPTRQAEGGGQGGDDPDNTPTDRIDPAPAEPEGGAADEDQGGDHPATPAEPEDDETRETASV